MAIEALDQEPTTKNDLAQERYQDLKEYFGDKETTILENKKEFKAWLERVKWHVKRADELARELEALEQEPRWIPVSERLPEDKQEILVTRKSGKIECIMWNTWWHKQTRYPSDKVTAWMPLPEPYKSESEDKE